EIPSPTKGSTKAAASPTCNIVFCTGSGLWKTSGDVLTVSIVDFHVRLRSRKAGCWRRMSDNVFATSARTMAHALIRVPEPFVAVETGCTPQYPPSKKYKSVEADAEAS